ncbi:MAG: lycopene cyclase domain-containing protein [Saprospiraceae bacterium]
MNKFLIEHKPWMIICFLFMLLCILWVILKDDIQSSNFEWTTPNIVRWELLETKYLYLIHHCISFIPVFLISVFVPFFSSRFSFHKDWLKPIFYGSLIFVLWDLAFTFLGIWSFNPRYIMGIKFVGLPIEEFMWFPCIGFCSIYIYALLERSKPTIIIPRAFYWAVMIGLLILEFKYFDKLYTGFSIWVVMLTLGLFWKFQMGKVLNLFVCSFGIIIFPMYIMDGLLTGMFTKEAVVIYNPLEFSGIRIISIPIEDFLFGFSFIGQILFLKCVISRRMSSTYTL